MARSRQAQKTNVWNLHNIKDLESECKGKKLDHVEELILSKNSLRDEVPVIVLSAIDPLRIIKLNMEMNSITMFSFLSKQRFRNLTVLRASRNDLIDLHALRSLNKLKELDVSQNARLKSLRGAPISLQTIVASKCSIEDVSSVFYMKNLRILRLDNNKLKQFEPRDDDEKIDREFDDFRDEILSHIEELDLSYNEITSFPSVILKMINVKKIFLSHNRIQKIPNWKDLKNLKVCHLHENEFKEAIPLDHHVYSLHIRDRRLDMPDLVLDADSTGNGRLWISNLSALHCEDFLRREKIRYVVSVVKEMPMPYPEGVTHLRISERDISETNLKQHFNSAIKFIHNARSNGESILVHCRKGRSRSATIILAYMLWLNNNTYSKDCDHEAILKHNLFYLQSKRPIVEPNEGFMKQLRSFLQFTCD